MAFAHERQVVPKKRSIFGGTLALALLLLTIALMILVIIDLVSHAISMF